MHVCANSIQTKSILARKNKTKLIGIQCDFIAQCVRISSHFWASFSLDSNLSDSNSQLASHFAVEFSSARFSQNFFYWSELCDLIECKMHFVYASRLSSPNEYSIKSCGECKKQKLIKNWVKNYLLLIYCGDSQSLVRA